MAKPGRDHPMVKPSYEYNFLSSPIRVEAEKSLQNLAVERRKCFMPLESHLSPHFSRYSQDSCSLERKIAGALSTTKCVPWNAPFLLANITRLCDLTGLNTFEKAMNTRFSQKVKWNCEESCEILSYPYKQFKETLGPDEHCAQIGANLRNSSAKLAHYSMEIAKNGLPKENYLQYLWNSEDFSLSCMLKMAKSSVIYIKPAKPRVQYTQLRKRVSFSSTLAVIGEKST